VRYFFKISYKGTSYHGWQKQPNAVSVQEVLESHLSNILRTDVEIVGSGRTDTGVHARQQYFHLDIPMPQIRSLIRELEKAVEGREGKDVKYIG